MNYQTIEEMNRDNTNLLSNKTAKLYEVKTIFFH